jgi:hypothetical protein
VTAAVAVTKATPDGYTAVLALNPALRKELPYDPEDFMALTLVAGAFWLSIPH